MALAKRYEDGFNSLDGIAYRVEIWQEGYTGSVQSVAFSSKPLVLKWSETDKLAPIQSSSATLRLFSDTDRQFLDLYTVKAGAVRMDVYRDGQLYWSGTLDPELYEEPYSYKERYTVELTFSDFAILDRLSWSERGFIAIAEVIRTALAATGIQTGGTMQHVSTRLSRADEDLLARIAVSGMNFFDEDDEPMTLRKVLEETLRPFALRIVQKAGRIHVYDLNAIYSAFTPTEFYWSSDDAILGADAVYNNVKISYSPYGVSSLADASVDKDSVSGTTYRYPLRPEDSAIAGFDLTLSQGGQNLSLDLAENKSRLSRAQVKTYSGLTQDLATANSRVGNEASSETTPGIAKSASASYFRVTPLLTGSDDSGVAQRVVYSKTGTAPTVLVDDSGKTGMVASLPQRIFLCNTGNFDRFRLRLKVEMLVDDRLNPYDEDQQADLLGQDKDDVGKLLDDVAKIWYQKCALSLYPAATGGSASYTYRNSAVIQSAGDEYYEEKGEWIDPASILPNTITMALCYYEEAERENTCAVRGWKTNKQYLWNYWEETPYLWRLRGDGEFIPLPPTGGYLDFQIEYSAQCLRGSNDLYRWNELYRLWHLYRSIKLDLVDAETYKEIPQEDIETTAWLNPDAKEELTIDTIVGCMDTASPIAKGQLFDATDGYAVVSRFSRAGVMDRLEKLLIGTVYSNYATRHHTLSGETDLLPTFTTYTDRNLPGVYLLLKETQDLAAGTSSVLAVQVDEDEYQGA